MKPIAAMTALLAAAAVTAPRLMADGAAENAKRIQESATVLHEIMDAKDQTIPADLLGKARCVGIVPNLKRAGFIIGGQFGKGVLTCRTGTEGWSAPSIVRIEGGSIGAQIGAGETDVVFVVMNDRGMQKLMSDKFTIGGDAAVMAGPVGRTAAAQTDAQLHAEILSYSRSRGIFAGVTLNGATLRPDNDDNEKLYGKKVTQQELLDGKVTPPASAKPLYDALKSYAGVVAPKKG
jgi:SH3 domain-containing YSC84-like protein 1